MFINPPYPRNAFTLIELLVVMGIIALMIGLAVPAMNNIGKGSAVSTGANELANVLTLARAKAITSRSHTRMIFSNGANTNVNIISKVSYAVLLLTNRNSDTVANWVYLDRWQSLPKGAYFSTLPSSLSTSMPFPTNQTSGGVTIEGIEFKSTGALTLSGDQSIAVQAGTVINGTLVGTNAANTLTNRIFAATGKVKILR